MKDKSILLRMSEKFKKETARCAEIEQENLSEYARKAVETRNKHVAFMHNSRSISYQEDLKAMPENARKVYVEGDWDNCEDLYCDGCVYLSPNELEQNCIPGKPDHKCTKYNKTVFHNGHHPYITRLDECTGKVLTK